MQLTIDQRNAVFNPSPNVVVVACPGSGKTTVLVEKILNEIRNGADQKKIVAITYTNAAAHELRSRLSKFNRSIGFVGTIHSYSLRLLERHGKEIGLPHSLCVMDEDASEELLKECAKRVKFTGSLESVRRAFDSYEDQGGYVSDKCLLAVRESFSRMKEHGLISYSAILWFARRLLAKHQLEPLDLLCVDEYQDCQDATHAICQALPSKKRFIVGDPNQSIYSFGGGNIRHMMTIARDSNWSLCELVDSQRCCDVICRAASSLIAHNRGNIIDAFAGRGGGDLMVVLNETAEDEKVWVQRYVKECAKNDVSVAVLCRTNALVNEMRDALIGAGFDTGQRLTTPADWKAAKTLLMFLTNPDNDYLARLFLTATRGERVANEMASQAGEQFMTINRLHLKAPTNCDAQTALAFLRRAGIFDQTLSAISDASPDAESANDLLLGMENNQTEPIQQSKIDVTTIHKSKGCEWDAVVVVGAEEGCLPSGSNLEEERRLMFVAVTRARSSVALSWSVRRRNTWTKVLEERTRSRFIDELSLS